MKWHLHALSLELLAVYLRAVLIVQKLYLRRECGARVAVNVHNLQLWVLLEERNDSLFEVKD